MQSRPRALTVTKTYFLRPHHKNDVSEWAEPFPRKGGGARWNFSSTELSFYHFKVTFCHEYNSPPTPPTHSPTPQIPIFLIFPQQKGKGLHFAFILCRLEHLNQKYWAQLCPVLGMGLWEAKRDTSTRSYLPISSLSYKMAKQISFCLCFSLSIPVIKTPHLLSLTQCFFGNIALPCLH